jgi:hypothetical protein
MRSPQAGLAIDGTTGVTMRWIPGTYEVRGGIHVWVEGRWVSK